MILINLLYRKDELYYPKVFLEKKVIHSDDLNDSNDSIKKLQTKKIKKQAK